ncbi:small conductance mechanosensitive channel [Paenibacillus turicensis]|uniref:Small conductance mechanosensitive channel n=1 Tax=Paenibacillus turicensis TaxID=160487 RepID=A0ABS4FUL5_9BACL|nr:mechanosensitive ion channel family protein [Paenibacillus turicensis]MBP1906271.1 small conductance mechanosensitive channel [Paenibacillus turicensis]
MYKLLSSGTDGADPLNEVTKWSDTLFKSFTNAEMWERIMFSSLRIVLIFILTRIAIRIIYKVIDRSLKRKDKSRLKMNRRRFVTLGKLLKNVTSIVSNLIMVMLIFGEFGFDVRPLLAGASVLGLAIGFGAQSLVKDVMTGFFIILEDQFAVGDVIQTGTLRGTVEMIGLRSTRLVSSTGEVHIIPNGIFTNVTNYSVGNSVAIVDVPFSTDKQYEETTALMKKAMQKLAEENEYITEMPTVLGIQTLSTTEFMLRIMCKCPVGAKSEIERLIHKYVKQALEQQAEVSV